MREIEKSYFSMVYSSVCKPGMLGYKIKKESQNTIREIIYNNREKDR